MQFTATVKKAVGTIPQSGSSKALQDREQQEEWHSTLSVGMVGK